jgi:hypothetical protein
VFYLSLELHLAILTFPYYVCNITDVMWDSGSNGDSCVNDFDSSCDHNSKVVGLILDWKNDDTVANCSFFGSLT